MRKSSRSNTTRLAFLIGLGFTLAALGVSTTQLGARLDRYALDLHFRWVGGISPDDRIVLIDIDDAALADMPEWPWPRRRFAQLVAVLDELDARAIGLDLVFSEPAMPRVAGLPASDEAQGESGARFSKESLWATVINDDAELACALKNAGRVYIGAVADFSVTGTGGVVTEDQSRLRDGAVQRKPHPKGSAAPGDDEALLSATIAQVSARLVEEFGRTQREMIEAWDGPGDQVDLIPKAFVKAKRMAARRLARLFLTNKPQGQLDDFLRRVLPRERWDADSPDRETLERAWHEELAWRAMSEGLPEVSSAAPRRFPAATGLIAPVEELIEASAGVGLVSYIPDPVDGRLRTVPLCGVVRGRVVPHLGTRIAADILQSDPCERAQQQDRDAGSTSKQPPVDARGETLIYWTRPSGAAMWLDVFTHVPVTRLLEVALNREAIENNDVRLRVAWAGLVARRHKETIAAYNDYVRLVNERLILERHKRECSGEESDLDARIASLAGRIAEVESEAAVWLRRMYRDWQQTEPISEQEREERDRILALYASLIEGALADALAATNEQLRRRNEALLTELRPLIAGRVCLVGYTASAQADMVATPVFERMPGVMAHSNVINMLLQGAFVRRAGPWTAVVFSLVAGLVVSWIAARRGALNSLLLALLVGVLLLAGGAVSFRFFDYYAATAPALIAVILPWGAVTVFRQFTEERARRDFERALSLYTSPAVAARIAERSDRRDLAPRLAEVTCFFSDLQGFTRLSEALGPARTRDVLNPFLEGVAHALAHRGGLVNKFMGDGVFAFFNAPILPCADHAQAACDAAIESVRCLAARERGGDAQTAERPLVVRIGLASGPVFVGDYGSDAKLDYTCIGDTVNVASRLEQLNKLFGTTILVNEACRRGAGESFAFRPIGLISVSGRTEPVSVYELRGIVRSLDERTVRFDEAFARLVGAFQSGALAACRAALDECRDINPADRVLAHYRKAIEAWRDSDLPADWRGVLDAASHV